MKKRILFWCFILLSANSFGQQFMQYNTGSLYDSFENPAQRAFIPDTTRQFAFNFLIPNFSGGGFFTGNTQQGLKTRLFSSYYNTANLKTGENAYNRLNFNYNHYSVMFKVFASENGDQEVGFFFNTKGQLKGIATDESLALFNGYTNFPLNSYNNIFNDSFHYQLYHQIGFTYREQVSRNLAIGVKLSALSGLLYRKVNITQSSVTFNRDSSNAILSAEGYGNVSNTDGRSDFQKYGPSFLNPGAAVSVGLMINDDAGYKWQVNVKDLGFIHWNSKSRTGTFGGTYTINGFTSADRENAITAGVADVTTGSQKEGSFTTNTNGLLEVSVNKSYWIDNNQEFKFSPTLIGSKELFYPGFTAAFLAPVQKGNYNVALMGTYNDLKLFNMGFQFMIKKENSEFFFGSERLFQTIAFTKSAMYPPARRQQEVTLGSHSGLDFFIGASFKFGYLIERRLNSSSIPSGDTRGFLGRTWDKLFGKKDPNYD